MNKTKTFVAHQNLIYDVMTRQAGTVGKAILEAVMNAIDAKAPQIDITLSRNHFQIVDNGVGIQTEEEIDANFATLGQPHQKGENGELNTTFGEFRMGRGQIFAQGKTTWKTHHFVLEVDIKNKGLDFSQTLVPNPITGCDITTELYQEMTTSGYIDTIAELRSACAHAPGKIVLNGDVINTPPSETSWTKETDDAYFKLTKGGSYSGVKVYQRGIFVEEIPTYRIGVSGKVVSKARFKLNFARNQIMRDCPVWKRINSILESHAEIETKRETTLSKDQCLAQIRKIASEPNSAWQHTNDKIFEDIQGKRWNLKQIRTGKGFQKTPDLKTIYTFSPTNSQGDKIMQRRLAIVFPLSLLEHIQDLGIKITKEKFFETLFGNYETPKYADPEELSKELDTTYTLLEPKTLSEIETCLLNSISKAGAIIAWDAARHERTHRVHPRTLRIGTGPADGWTNGSTYIAINRDFLKNNNKGTMRECVNIATLLLHEYCHDSEDQTGHGHPVEFYQNYERLSRHILGRVAQEIFDSYAKTLEEKRIKLNKKRQRQSLQANLNPSHIQTLLAA
jgi:hypothetical protein